MTRDRSQMTLEAFEPQQQRLTDAEVREELEEEIAKTAAPEPRALADDTTSAVERHGIDADTIPAVAPRGALELLRTMEGAA